ncbi:helix-turn-helix domain-containing protein [Synergistaceae bacterium OttesenSCG-928-I11]|nr:helix-turn-helix domain-containing protein [Synergistaceae bacterium OttesenSCG-928-I11]
MTEKTTPNEEKLAAFALTMPTWEGFMIDKFKKDPSFAKMAIADELEEYAETGEIAYLLSTLRQVAAAKGMVKLAKEAGLGRTTLYEVLNGSNPRIATLNKILNALGFRMLFVAVDNAKIPAKSTRKRTAATKTPKQEKQLQHA